MVGDNIRTLSFAYIIEPARFTPITGWSHEDYMAMWYEVLRRFVFTAVFVRDWEYSGGCCNEYAFSAELGLPRVDENLEPISTWTALDMMLAASERIRQLGKKSPIRDAAIAKLAKIVRGGEVR